MRDVFQVLGLCIKNLWDLSDAGLRLQQGRGSRLQSDAVQCNGEGAEGGGGVRSCVRHVTVGGLGVGALP